ncbi:alpha/beta fold hydrolase [Kibdelosporangium persicum]|uniref:Pimeloyl-ACP methyl ester carboxylesterase n=1 Tax=Kibdelosporangium persicum TaxID=2698649 RepID=A0ABX2EXZ5_9PSEU|nr:alpha/beta hydrolase [Kibdelosporangium persicum]NRN63858.1 Pimeloyl-ACP methyl ester carboxylesterase [Kibdelosporangium persicum]
MVPIVLVHGIRAHAGAWVAYSFGHPVDLPGHGVRLGGTFTMPSAVSVVADAIDSLGGRALVVGHSMGGYVSMAVAAAHPSRVAGLVIAGATTVPDRFATAPFLAMYRMLSRLPDGGDRLSRRIFSATLPSDVAAAVTSGPIATPAIPSVVAALRSFDPLSAVARYPGPTWFINGGHDHLRFHERKFLAAAQNGRLIVIPGTGHYLPMTHPTLFARHILDAAAVVHHSA